MAGALSDFMRRPVGARVAIYLGVVGAIGLLYWQFGLSPLHASKRAAEEARRERHVVARERAPAGRAEMAGGALAEGAPFRVERPDLGEVLVRLLEVPADRLVVFDGVDHRLMSSTEFNWK